MWIMYYSDFFFTQNYAVLHSDMLGPFLIGSCYLLTLQGLLGGSQSSAICVHWLIYFVWLSKNFQACTEQLQNAYKINAWIVASVL